MRLIDADALPKLLDAEYKQTMKLIWEGEKHLDTLAEGFAEAMRIAKYIAPTVDAVPVVRCKDCKYFQHDGRTSVFIGGKYVKSGWCTRRILYDKEYRMPPDGFCSCGRRKEDEQ